MTIHVQFRSQLFLFSAGTLATTPGVKGLIQSGQLNPAHYLSRHLQGDWGDLCSEDRRRNDIALKNEDRLLSSYKVTDTLILWIITEWDRSVTTLLLPSEY